MDRFLLTDTMDFVYDSSVSAIGALQQRFQQQGDVFFMVSNVFDPRYAFLFYAPLIFALDWNVGKKVMWVAVIAEWSNQVLKWMLHGERPYWWIHETPLYNRTGVDTPAIQQYFLTCETGPGSPSGHVMVSAALFYVIIEALLQKSGALKKNSKNFLASMCWSTYTLILLSVSLSRVYIAAHFPHQCLLGMVIGCGVAMAMERLKTDELQLRHYVLATIGLLATALGTFAGLRLLGLNPMWSVDRAVKWCAKQEYIHIDTTPFFSMMRYAGFTLGMGLGLNSALFRQVASNRRITNQFRFVWAVLAVAVTKLSERVVLPKFSMALFYFLAFLENALLPYLFIAVVPFCVQKMWPFLSKARAKQP